MKKLTTAIFSKLSGSALADHIANRLFQGEAPAGVDYPYIVYLTVSTSPDNKFGEDWEETVIQFSLFSSDSESTEIEDMFIDLKTLYDECDMTIGSGGDTDTLICMRRDNASLMIEDHTTPDGTRRVWHYAVDYTVIVKD